MSNQARGSVTLSEADAQIVLQCIQIARTLPYSTSPTYRQIVDEQHEAFDDLFRRLSALLASDSARGAVEADPPLES